MEQIRIAIPEASGQIREFVDYATGVIDRLQPFIDSVVAALVENYGAIAENVPRRCIQESWLMAALEGKELPAPAEAAAYLYNLYKPSYLGIPG